MDQCPNCEEYWVRCPCCKESFCPDCGMLESDAEHDGLYDDEM